MDERRAVEVLQVLRARAMYDELAALDHAIATIERERWRPIAEAPEDGFYLVSENGAVRTMFRHKGEWSLPDIPVLVNEFGDRMVSREVSAAYSRTLEVSGVIQAPTHWMPLPPLPDPQPDGQEG